METMLLEHTSAAAKAQVKQAAEATSTRLTQLAAQAGEIEARAAVAAQEYRRTIKREVGRAIRRVDYAKQESAYRIKQAPFTAVAIACAVGFIGGAAAFLVLTRTRAGCGKAPQE
jgi:ElaB/YqjD/DUF883 family membrane-anchored ribosome-binding protein